MMGVLAAVEGGEGDDELMCCWRRSDFVGPCGDHDVHWACGGRVKQKQVKRAWGQEEREQELGE
jgi:hypothetical protein